jgi:hypothetical protein
MYTRTNKLPLAGKEADASLTISNFINGCASKLVVSKFELLL